MEEQQRLLVNAAANASAGCKVLQLPAHLLCEVVSRCPDASTANALTSTCRQLHQLRKDPSAASLALIRRSSFASWFTAAAALAACGLESSPAAAVLLSWLSAGTTVGGPSPAPLQLVQALQVFLMGAGDMRLLKKLLSLQLLDISAPFHGYTALERAVALSSDGAAVMLLAHGADPLANNGLCLKIMAGYPRRLSLLHVLLERFTFSAETIIDALSAACQKNNMPALVALLPLHVSSLDTCNMLILGAVLSAVDTGSLDMLHFLAGQYGNREALRGDWGSGLKLAARIGHAPSAALLLQQGALVDDSMIPSLHPSWSAMHLDWATAAQRQEVEALLKAHGARMLVEVEDGVERWTLLSA